MVKIINPSEETVSITIDDRDYTVGPKESTKVNTEADAVKWLSTHQFLIRGDVEVATKAKTDAELAKEAEDAKKAEEAAKADADAKAEEAAKADADAKAAAEAAKK